MRSAGTAHPGRSFRHAQLASADPPMIVGNFPAPDPLHFVLPGSIQTQMERRAAFEQMMKDLDALGQVDPAPDYWRKLVNLVAEGFRDLYPPRFTGGRWSLMAGRPHAVGAVT